MNSGKACQLTCPNCRAPCKGLKADALEAKIFVNCYFVSKNKKKFFFFIEETTIRVK